MTGADNADRALAALRGPSRDTSQHSGTGASAILEGSREGSAAVTPAGSALSALPLSGSPADMPEPAPAGGNSAADGESAATQAPASDVAARALVSQQEAAAPEAAAAARPPPGQQQQQSALKEGPLGAANAAADAEGGAHTVGAFAPEVSVMPVASAGAAGGNAIAAPLPAATEETPIEVGALKCEALV